MVMDWWLVDVIDADGRVSDTWSLNSIGGAVLGIKNECEKMGSSIKGPEFMRRKDGRKVLRYVCGSMAYEIYPYTGVEKVGNSILEMLYPDADWKVGFY